MSKGREKRERDDATSEARASLPVVISMTVLLGMAALVLDLGPRWYAKRQLQASVDAAALAGAEELPSNANAVARAHEYIVKTPTRGVSDLQDTTITKCRTTAPGCAPVNALTVKATAKADTAFARIFGINSMTVGAKAHRLSALRREAARHRDRARPHGLDGPGRHARQADEREVRGS